MIKTAIATLAATAAVVAPSAAFAGPYVNVEANSSFTGSDYTGTTTDAHVGYAGDIGSVGYYAQVGPSFVTTDGGESDTVLSGKVGASVAATESLSIYGEFAFAGGIDDADNGYGTKAGVTWSF
jgi:hypothetical protein|tara:strand:+ start:586 stop:957 length:372 start_codon:yes stop_codon:yes gene_type:complete